MSKWALLLIAAVATLWSTLGGLGLLGWDPHFYYGAMQDGTWQQVYRFEQAMFWIVGAFNPGSFASYEFLVVAIPLSVLLVAFYRLGYAPLDQLILIFFFCCSFYGLHFLLTFQRQFFGLAFFLLAISGQKRSIIARAVSLFSQLYTVILHLFWQLRRLPARAAAITGLLLLPVAIGIASFLLSDKTAHYASYGVDKPFHLALKQGLTVGFCFVVLSTLEHGQNALRSITTAYIALSLPVMLWPFYAGVFARLDYFFFPAVVALWPQYVRANRRVLTRVCIAAFTVIGFALWMKLNAECVVMGGDCPL